MTLGSTTASTFTGHESQSAHVSQNQNPRPSPNLVLKFLKGGCFKQPPSKEACHHGRIRSKRCIPLDYSSAKGTNGPAFTAKCPLFTALSK